ncbi:MAG: family peptidase [Acidobacteriales bacterium]|nr:family peptidase [Terriglobales bacterium]
MRTFVFCAVLLGSISVFADGPQNRSATDPKSITSAQSAKAAPVSVEDLFFTRRIGSAAWSPDGSEIAFVTNASGRVNVWKMKSDGSGAQQLATSNDRQSNPSWSSDGKFIVYEQDKGGDENYDLFAIPSNGGTPVNLTSTDSNREDNAHFSPDGKWIAFQSKLKSAAVTNVGVMDWKTREVKLLTTEKTPDHSWSVAFWSPADKYVYAVRTDRGNEDSDIYRVNVVTGSAENLTPHSGKILNRASSISPDGKHVLMSSTEHGGYSNVALLDLAGKQKKWVTNTQWDADSGDWSTKGDRFVYSLNANGRTSLYFGTPSSPKGTKINLPEGINSEAGNPHAFSPDGTMLLVYHQDSTKPNDVWVVPVAGGEAKQLTESARPALVANVLPKSQIISYKTFDGKMISALLWMPFNLKRDGTNPAVVYPHGGPTGQTRDAFASTPLALASRGYIVIAPNVRGSTGYGMEFQKANHQDLGGGDLQDEVYAVKWLQQTGYVDSKKIGIAGGSYGGFMTLMAIGKVPEMWGAAVSLFGIIDWKTMLEHSDPSLQEYEKSLLGDPVKDAAVYDAASPIKYIRNAKAPLLVLQGERDIRVPAEEARQVVEILKSAGKTVDANYYAEEGHGFMKRENQIDSLNRLLAWFDKYLKGNKAAD